MILKMIRVAFNDNFEKIENVVIKKELQDAVASGSQKNLDTDLKAIHIESPLSQNQDKTIPPACTFFVPPHTQPINPITYYLSFFVHCPSLPDLLPPRPNASNTRELTIRELTSS